MAGTVLLPSPAHLLLTHKGISCFFFGQAPTPGSSQTVQVFVVSRLTRYLRGLSHMGSHCMFYFFFRSGVWAVHAQVQDSVQDSDKVAMSPLSVERQGVHPRVSGNLKHVWVCSAGTYQYATAKGAKKQIRRQYNSKTQRGIYEGGDSIFFTGVLF